jgi:hypothetical protein
MRWSSLIGSAGVCLIGCTLFGDVDDLAGSAGDGGAAGHGEAGAVVCQAESGCLGCPSCETHCACTDPFAIAQCIASCVDAAAAGGASGSDAGDAADGHDAALCDPTAFLGKQCAAANSGTDCGTCLTESCCPELAACFSDTACAGFWGCYASRCAPSGSNDCALAECGSCFQSSSFEIISALSSCSQANCAVECS